MRMNTKQGLRALALVGLLGMAGCRSAPEKAHLSKGNQATLDHAKGLAALTGLPQRVMWREKDGTTVTTVVQPPAPGEATEQMTVTRSKPVDGPVPGAMAPGQVR